MDLTNTQPGDRVLIIATGRAGTVTRVIDRDGAIGGLVEVRRDGERRPRPGAGFEAGRDLAPLSPVGGLVPCSGCALCDPAIAAAEALADEAAFADWV